MSAPLLRIRGLGWRTAGLRILEGISLDVAAGEFVAVLGRNGAGKSTLIDIIAGIRDASDGAVELAGRRFQDWAPMERARLMAHLPQHLRADMTLTAAALVLMGRYAHATGWFESAADREIAGDAMRRCNCFGFRDRPLGTLSGGERQRVFLAACLAQQPRLLLLDEPATFLDVDQQLECFALLRHEASHGIACMAVTHDVNLALTFCSRLIVLADGAIAHDLAAAAALDAPDWLRLVSTRLAVDRGTSDERPWVRYR
jgi:iron complex transport system ATP-binding protein